MSISRRGLMPDLRRTRTRPTQGSTTTRNTPLDLSWDPLLSRLAGTPALWNDRPHNAVRTAAALCGREAPRRHVAPSS